MSNVFGNRGGGGGFANPAEEELNMNNYKITQLAQAVATGDAQGYGQDALFSSVNMNNNWIIPNTQPSSPNDVNTYNLSARGGLINVTTTPSLPSGIFTFSILRTLPFTTQYTVNISVPSGLISWPDLQDFFINSFNSQTAADGYPFITFTGGFITTPPPFRFSVTVQNGQANTNGWLQTYIIGSNFPDTVYSVFGINGVTVLNYGALGIGAPLTLQSQVGWSSSNSSFPIQNGSPYIYSTAQDKWYCGDSLYTPNFQSYIDFNNSSYNLIQNSVNRFKINSTDAVLYSPSSSNYVDVSNAGLSYTQGGAIRISSTAFSTYLSAANGITNCSVSNNGVVLNVDTVARFSALSAGATTIKSSDDQSIINMTNTDITMTQGGFTKFSMNEDQAIGTSLWGPSGSGRIQLINSGITLRQNSINRFTMNNVESYLYSPSLLNNSYIGDNSVSLTFNSLARALINSSFTQLTSPNNTGIFTLTDISSELRVNSSLRFVADGTETRILSPNFNVETTFNDTTYYVNMGGYERILIDATKTTLNSPSSATYLFMNSTGFVMTVGNLDILESSVGGLTQINSPDRTSNLYLQTNKAVISNGPNVLLIDATISLKDINRVRFLMDATKCRTSSPDGLNYIDVNNTGLTYSDNGANRLSVSDTTTYMTSPNSSTYCSVSNTGAALTVDSLNRFTAASGGNTTIKSSDNTTTVTLAGDNFTASTSTNSLVVNADFNYTKGAQLRIHADNSHSQLVSPNGTQALEVNNTGVQINLSANSYTLPTTRGTSGQVMTITGSNCSWTTPGVTPGTSINSGWSFLPMSSITATATAATRSFYYISMVPLNTVITGIKAYINTPGADFINCAIYRGKNNVVGSTLVMTSGRVTVLSTVDANNYMTLPLTLQAGQSNVFTAGEYVTICYHSSGSGAVYYICAAAPANLGISYISTACYAAAGTPTFPANLSLVTPSTTNTIRTHFEFY